MRKEFKVWYNNKPATREQLDAIEEIVVEQEIGCVWEARIKIPVCITEEGLWHGEDDPAHREFTRVRVEARINNGDWAPLIDGRIVGRDGVRSAAPGHSTLTLIVHDDSAMLHREVESNSFSGQTDSEIASSIFLSSELKGAPDGASAPARSDTEVIINQCGTKMQLLRQLASRNGDFYAYVLPGEMPGMSVGCFKRLPEQPDPALPELTLLGECRNLSEFNVTDNSAEAADIDAAFLKFSDKSIQSGTFSYRDAPRLKGARATDAPATETRRRRLAPGVAGTTDPQSAVEGAAARSGYTLSAEGSVLPLRYTGILLPYKKVPVRLSDTRYSADYIIFKVVHTLGISEYTQSFSMRANAVSEAASPTGGLPAPSASANGAAAVSFNIQMDIF